MRFFSLAKHNAEQFVKDGKINVRIAKANKKNSYVILHGDMKPSKNFKIIETLN